MDNLTSKRNLIDKDEEEDDEFSPRSPSNNNSNSTNLTNNTNIQLRTSTTDSIPSQNGLSDIDEDAYKE